LGGAFIPSGNIIQITVPPALKKYPDVASRYENVSFSRKTATRKKKVDLLGIGHPFIDALLDFYKSESMPAELLNVRCDSTSPCLTVRYIFTLEFRDGTKRELYQSFLIDGKEELSDLDFLARDDFRANESLERLSFVEDKIKMFTQNQEAKIRSDYDGVINVRHKCVGIQAIS
ncbi:MAG: hypothetical protein K8S15_09200, partial [Candidatus Aegiribacteria sp.]|nr:hypothetical protein [Candidatus Aegiribacteria sp.]